ncbi:lactate utilization protein [Solirubrobacter sp. CPCC 204708]|uniref:Lactate utilization protein n=1 Tax=Solirubrobacter deserti TaxID=2282478 RepID=A0ABT4RM48_9ACTN|nr:lactate utilization protein B [Solirubrobacter deserti]MBE2320464.1 lactate utilization protein [Solirubrobacter deserti]MDA0139345.1 lactate utilization protein [Solirubrobacter deserti]
MTDLVREAGTRGAPASSLRDRERAALAGSGHLQVAIRRSTDNMDGRWRGLRESLPGAEELREAARSLRSAAITRLPELLGQLADNVEAAGGRVFFAADADEATGYITELAQRRGATRAVKAKSMVTEEIQLNARLAEVGVTAVETDLGEWAQQLDGEPPAHILGPALHKTQADWVRVLRPEGYEGGEDPDAMCAFARRTLRPRFLDADLGITGVNLAVASTGTLVMVTNEGNGRLTSGAPPVHVAVMGMERVVADWPEVDLLLALLGRAGSGVNFPTYVNCLTGPRRESELDGPEELHLVIVDNGRSKILGSPSQEALNCIRCGACLNACPVFRQIGGHAYGDVYSGPIGAVIVPLLSDGNHELSHASSLCGACWEACPVKIPLHELLLEGRAQHAGSERALWRAWARAWSSPRAFALTGAPAGLRPPQALVPPPFREWAKGRTLPRREGSTFRTRWARGEVLD